MHKHINYQLYFRASTGNQKLLNINKHTNRDEQEKVGERENEKWNQETMPKSECHVEQKINFWDTFFELFLHFTAQMQVNFR